MTTVHLKINNKSITAEDTDTILTAATKNGIKIPTLCYLKDITKSGACRVCLVEVKKAKTLSIGQLNSFANTILPRISTNITSGDILGLIPSLASMSVDESIGWPYETKGITLDRWYGIPVTLESNVKKLHQEAFEQADYEPSETVKEMSNAIIKKTGYTE